MTLTQTPPSPPQQARPRGLGLAVTALILAVVSLLLCWIPIVNNVVFFLGLLALVVALAGYIRSRRSGRATTMTVIAAVIALLSLAGVLITQAFYVSVLDGVGQAVEDAADGDVAQTQQDKDAAAAADVHSLGDSAQVGDFTVTVDQVRLNADRQVQRANEFNSAPKGRYVLVHLEIRNDGKQDSEAWLDLSTKLSGSDSRTYDTSTCEAAVSDALLDEPTIRPGGTASGNVCFDVPTAALTDPKILVEETLSLDEHQAFWASR